MNPKKWYLKLKRQILIRAHDTELWASYLPHLPVWLYFMAILGSGLITAAVLGIPSNRWGFRLLFAICGFFLWLPVLKIVSFARKNKRRRTAVRQQILNSVPWRGDEAVLDVGCGSGMLLNGAAARLVNGRAVGIDIWAEHGGGGNLDLLLKHARAENVAERIIFQEADARQMPFEDGSFDVVLSSWAMHHITRSREDFDNLCHEMLRVLKTGGMIVVIDIEHMLEAFALRMEKAGVQAEFKPAPFAQKLLIGRKP